MASQRSDGCFECVVFLLVFCVAKVSSEKYGVLSARSGFTRHDFCMVFYPKFADLPEDMNDDVFKPLYYSAVLNTCENSSITTTKESFKDKIVLTQLRNCSLEIQAKYIKDGGGEGLLLYGSTESLDDENLSLDVHIPVAQVANRTVDKLQNMMPGVDVYLYAPPSLTFDYSLFLIWTFAVFAVVIGSYWSGIVRHSLHTKETSHLPEQGPESDHANKPTQTAGEESALNVSPLLIFVFVVCMGLTLLLLYYCFKYLVYVIIGLFVFASFLSVYHCLEPLVSRIPIGTCVVLKCNAESLQGSCEVRRIVLAVLSAALSITWVVLRKESYSWILQDILGIAFCINMLKSIRLPNMQICTILLTLLFFYDIFFVFITPLLTVKGESVMVEVATGGNSGEQIPMVLRVPHLTFSALIVCHYLQYSLLGFGDILVPGLLVAYCHGFDLLMKNGRVYFLITSIGYGIGLIITFVGLYLMKTAQPALLYLVPTTLLPPLIAGLCRKELSQLWWGVKRNHPSIPSPPSNNDVRNMNENVPNGSVPLDVPPTNTLSTQPIPRSGSFASESASEPGEEKLLLK